MVKTIFAFFAGKTISVIIGGIVFLGVTNFLGGLSATLIDILKSGLFDYVTNWVTIPVLGQVILYGQAIAIVAVIAIRIAVGLNKGILQDELRAPEYLFKSVGAVILIAVMPLLCSLVINFGQHMMSDVTSYSTKAMDLKVDSAEYVANIASNCDASNSEPLRQLANVAARSLVSCICLVMMVMVYLQLMIRQIQMLVISVAAPWVGIKVATENDSDQYWAFLANLVGMCVIQMIQTLFLGVSMQVFEAYAGNGNAEKLFSTSPDGWYKLAILIAILVATQQIPSLLDRWTFSGGSAGNPSMVMAAGFRGMKSSGSGVGQTAGNAARAGIMAHREPRVPKSTSGGKS